MAAYQDTCKECGRVYDTSMGHVKRYLQEGYCSEGCKRRAEGGSSSSGGGGGGGGDVGAAGAAAAGLAVGGVVGIFKLLGKAFYFIFWVFAIKIVALGVFWTFPRYLKRKSKKLFIAYLSFWGVLLVIGTIYSAMLLKQWQEDPDGFLDKMMEQHNQRVERFLPGASKMLGTDAEK